MKRTNKICIRLQGGLGDITLGGAYVKAFKDKYPQTCIDICTQRSLDTSRSIFYGQKFCKNIICDYNNPLYALIIDIRRFPRVLRVDREKLKSTYPILHDYVVRLEKFEKSLPDLFKNDFLSVAYARLKGHFRHTQADILDNFNLKDSDFRINCALPVDEVLGKFGLTSDGFITIQRGVDPYDVNNRAHSSRVWSEKYFNQLCRYVHAAYPHYKIILLGQSMWRLIPAVDLDLRNKTSFEELKILLKHSRIHIDGDCGMVHLRHFLSGKKSVVLFGPTDERWLGYPENVNLAMRPCALACEHLHPEWRSKCAVTGSNVYLCQMSLTPELVFSEIEKILK